MSRPDMDAMATEVVLLVKTALGPVLERLAASEQRTNDLQARAQELAAMRDRLVSVETKAALPLVFPEPLPLVDLAPVQAALAAVQDQVKGFDVRWSDLGALRERVAVVESKVDQPVPTVLRSEELDISPVLERLASAEARLSVLGDLRDRVVTVETKAALPMASPAAVVDVPPVDLSPVLERLAAAEARLSVLGDLRDRVVTVETKAAMPLSVLESTRVDLAPVLERLAGAEARLTEVDKYAARVEGYTSFLQRDTAALSERIALVETRPLVPGPQGEPGPPGTNGIDGKDGTAGLTYVGVYQDGKGYELGDLATWAGSLWHANEQTTTKPGDGSKAWTLACKRGRDGKDGLPGVDGKPGRDLTEKAAWQR